MSTQMTIDDVDVDYLSERCEIRRCRILTDEQAERETQELIAVADERIRRGQYQTIVTMVLIVVLVVVCVFADMHSKIAALFA
jgi:hypothetical protein